MPAEMSVWDRRSGSAVAPSTGGGGLEALSFLQQGVSGFSRQLTSSQVALDGAGLVGASPRDRWPEGAGVGGFVTAATAFTGAGAGASTGAGAGASTGAGAGASTSAEAGVSTGADAGASAGAGAGA